MIAALTEVFGQAYTVLSEEARAALITDVGALIVEDGFTNLRDAASELRRRIGGAQNLKVYVDSLLAGR
jgi:hypothetical protein